MLSLPDQMFGHFKSFQVTLCVKYEIILMTMILFCTALWERYVAAVRKSDLTKLRHAHLWLTPARVLQLIGKLVDHVT